MDPQRATSLRYQAGSVFTPSSPVDRRNLFAGRINQLEQLIDAVYRRGGHAAVYGERGVGKTSIVSILADVLGANVVHVERQNCHSTDSYGAIWRRALGGIKFTIEKHRVGFDAGTVKRLVTLADSLSADPSPDEIVQVLRSVSASLVFVFDEFDQVSDPNVSKAFAETIKALSDYAASTTIVIVGIGDSIDQLLAAHASVERALTQVQMPRMKSEELREIIVKASAALEVPFDSGAIEKIIRLSQGLPHYVHLLGLNSFRAAMERVADRVSTDDVQAGIQLALNSTSHSMKDDYLRAVGSSQKKTLFPDILLACALAHADEVGSFASADVRDSLRRIGLDMDIPAFASHLNKFCQPDRGDVLQKRGTKHRFRYRFRSPLLQPYVLMRGIQAGRIQLDELLRDASAAPLSPSRSRRPNARKKKTAVA